MKIFKIGELIKASDINSNFSKCLKTDLSNHPVLPCSKGGTGRTDCSIAYADKAGIAEVAEVSKTAEKLVGSTSVMLGVLGKASCNNRRILHS